MNLKYYDWQSIFSYDAPITMVVGARGMGKTFGLRLALFRKWLKTGATWVEVCRSKADISAVREGYLSKLSEVYPHIEDYQQSVKNDCLYLRLDKNQEWKPIVYFTSLNSMRVAKQMTFYKVKSVVMDEAIIDRSLDKTSRYHKAEWDVLANLAQTVTRQATLDDPPKLYLMANAVDFNNPYFYKIGLKNPPSYGRHWYMHKSFLLDFVKPSDDYKTFTNKTLAGIMLEGSEAAKRNISNDFQVDDSYLIKDKPKGLSYMYTLKYDNMLFHIYQDSDDDIYITDEYKLKHRQYVYTLHSQGKGAHMVTIKKASPMIKNIIELTAYNQAWFSSPAVREAFYAACDRIGYR